MTRLMTDTLFSQSRAFLFGSNTRFQNRCDLKSKVGRCSGADLGFWEGFASVLDMTLKHRTKVTMALRGGRAFLDDGCAAGTITNGALSQHHGFRKQRKRPQQR